MLLRVVVIHRSQLRVGSLSSSHQPTHPPITNILDIDHTCALNMHQFLSCFFNWKILLLCFQLSSYGADMMPWYWTMVFPRWPQGDDNVGMVRGDGTCQMIQRWWQERERWPHCQQSWVRARYAAKGFRLRASSTTSMPLCDSDEHNDYADLDFNKISTGSRVDH